ncbi:ABC transporter permease [Commensalibacter oyaizuii]|uniref:ABC transporter permease n=1 Tax=Commensalibacter oyaizuii TaxID=3043873 RepID=A0ABT6Q3R5_9PROT|nr:ABC transporter permease [Commensalibacter sp. TBRC 16381]MDI2091755.1 ABC transporter permease [Commensalibacter sp. TBRC 16381]
MTLRIQNSNQASNNVYYLALKDIKESLQLWKLAFSLGWFDIKLRYKGSLLGPLWITSTSAVMIAAMGIIYGSLFKLNLPEYLPFVSLSIILWQLGITAVMVEGCHCFLQANDTIHSVKLPFFLQALRTIIRNGIIITLNMIVPFVVFLIFNVRPGWVALLSLPGFLLWIVDGLAICLLLGCICARFRDIPQIINSVIQIFFYITPIMWMPSQLKPNINVISLNPFYSIIEIIRTPLLGHIPPLIIWLYALGYSCLLWIIAGYIFANKRGRLAFWI